jgi:hypothetical protein
LDIHVYWNILTMHGPINVKSPNNTSKWQMGFNSAFKGLIEFQIQNGLKTEQNLSLYHFITHGQTLLTTLKTKYERSLSVTHHTIFG